MSDSDQDQTAQARRPRSYPEIIPPGTEPPPSRSHSGYVVENYPPRGTDPGPTAQRQRYGFGGSPATYVLVGVNVAVFVWMIFSGVSMQAPTSRDLLIWGADNPALVIHYGQWQRLLTATFVHVGIIHLATNMWCLWNLGLLGEPLLGSLGLLAVYLLTGIAGNLLSVTVNAGNPAMVGAGASGAVFGLAGVLIVLLKSEYLPVPREELRRLRRSVIYFAALNFAIGAGTFFIRSSLQIDNMAHLGGFLMGLAIGVPLVPRIGSGRSKYLRRQAVTFCAVALLMALFGYGLASYLG